MPPGLASAMTMKRITRELADLQKEDLGPMSLEPTEGNLSVWRGSIPGPQGSVYEGGVFDVDIVLPADYPFSAPKVLFKTRIYHMNISENGNICIDILKQNWSPALSLFKVMLSLSSLLTDPNPRDPLVPSIATQYVRNRKQHDDTARQWTASFATPKPPPPPPPVMNIPAAPQSASASGSAAGSSSNISNGAGGSRGKGKKKADPQPAPSGSGSGSARASGSGRSARSHTSTSASIASEVIDIDDLVSDEDVKSASAKGKKRKRGENGAGAGAGSSSNRVGVAGEVVDLVDESGEEGAIGTSASAPPSKRTRGRKPGPARTSTRRTNGTNGRGAPAAVDGEVIVIEDD